MNTGKTLSLVYVYRRFGKWLSFLSSLSHNSQQSVYHGTMSGDEDSRHLDKSS